MRTRMHIIFVAGFALTGAAMLSSPSQAQSAAAGATLGVPNVTAPTDSVRQGAAGINAAQAEATRTTGNAEIDARHTAENATAGVGDPTLGGNANAAGQSAAASGSVNSQGMANRATSSTMNRASNTIGRTEQEITRQLNREQLANASASVSGNAATR